MVDPNIAVEEGGHSTLIFTSSSSFYIVLVAAGSPGLALPPEPPG
jgi:hypothetical protein